MTTRTHRDQVVQREWIAAILEADDVVNLEVPSLAAGASVAITAPSFRTCSLPSCCRADAPLPGHRVALTLPSLADHAFGVEVVTGRAVAGERHQPAAPVQAPAK
jgi:hypothetical protein